MGTELAIPEEATVYRSEIATVTQSVQGVQVQSAEDYTAAAEHLKTAKALLKEADRIFDPSIKSAHETHRLMVKAKKDATVDLEAAVAMLAGRMGSWQQEQNRKAMQARLDQERDMREREKLAREAISQGNLELAKEVRAIPVSAPLPPPAPKIEGVSSRTTYSARVLDLKELVKAVAAGTVPINAVEPNMPFLNSLARAAKAPGVFMPGVESVETSGVAVRV